MIKLYRAVSQQEKDDYDHHKVFRTSKNTLEAKQFFKSGRAAKQFVVSAIEQDYDPPYAYLYIVDIDAECFDALVRTEDNLDGYDAVTIENEYLPDFNNCVKFVREEVL